MPIAKPSIRRGGAKGSSPGPKLRTTKRAKAAKANSRRRIARMPAKPLTGAAMKNAAYYAAGCAAVARGVRVAVDGAAINPRWKHEGEVDLGYGWCRDPETWHLICLAGPFAQRRFAPRSDWRSGNRDFDIVRKELSREFRGDRYFQEKYLEFMEAAAQRLVDHFWAEITVLANALIELGRLTGR
jgi:hypothetical protein